MRHTGANLEGGAAESLYALVAVNREEKVARFEVLEMDGLDAALARFEELSPATNELHDS